MNAKRFDISSGSVFLFIFAYDLNNYLPKLFPTCLYYPPLCARVEIQLLQDKFGAKP